METHTGNQVRKDHLVLGLCNKITIIVTFHFSKKTSETQSPSHVVLQQWYPLHIWHLPVNQILNVMKENTLP